MWAHGDGAPTDGDGVTGGTQDSGTDATAAGGSRRILAILDDHLDAEATRLVLWLPVALGLGIAAYFALRIEPAAWVTPLAAIPALWFTRQTETGWLRRWAAVGLALGVVGFGAAQLRTWWVTAPVLDGPRWQAHVTGRVASLETARRSPRMVLTQVAIDGVPAAKTPARVRLSLRSADWLPPPGSLVRVRAGLYPPAPPAAPGAYDFQRRAFFERLGAVGFARAPPQVVAPAEAGLFAWIGRQATAARQAIAGQVDTVAAPPASAVTTALLTGDRSGIDESVLEDFRAAGLAHLLAISGLHIALIAGLCFFVSRAAMAAIPALVLFYPIKKWAAVIGLLAAMAYMVLVGAPVPTQRSVLMTALVMLAILIDRNPFSMRTVAWASVVVLAVEPEAMLGPSFQMSFGAVVALIAVYERLDPFIQNWRRNAGWAGFAVPLYAVGLLVTSFVATVATLPFAMFHFQQVALYGLFANMLAVPLTAYWIMPWALLALILMPFGAGSFAVQAMNWGVSGLIGIADAVAAWPGSTWITPVLPSAGLGLIVLGGLWVALWQRAWRWWGLIAVVAGFATMATVRTPDLLITGDGHLMAVRTADGGLSYSAAPDSFAAEIWQQRHGRGMAPQRWPDHGISTDGRLSCDPQACLIRRGPVTVSVVRRLEALAEDCRSADVVVTPLHAWRCPAPLVIDRRALQRHGAHALVLHDDGAVTVRSVGTARGNRPWTTP